MVKGVRGVIGHKEWRQSGQGWTERVPTRTGIVRV